MAKMNMNYGMELMILILLVMIYPLLSLKCEEWDVDDFPPFVRELPQNGTEDFCNLYEQEMNISRYKFYDLMKAWARKYHVLVSCSLLLYHILFF